MIVSDRFIGEASHACSQNGKGSRPVTPVATSGFHGPLAAVFSSQLEGARLSEFLRSPATALPVASATDRSVWDPQLGSAHSPTIESIIRTARSERGTPWPQPLAHHAARLHRDGNRDEWEALTFERQRRLSRAAVAAASTLDIAWIDEVADGIVLLCEQSTWCWPAHDDSLSHHGSMVPVASDPFLDLGAGEIVGQLAWLDQLLGEQLDQHYPGLRARLRHEASARIFMPFLNRRDWHWLGLDGDAHNWNPWIHGNVIAAALRLLDREDDANTRNLILELAVDGIDRYLACLPEDGAIDEGYTYWWNGACRTLEALELLTHATNGRLEAIAAIPALRNTVAFPHRMHLGGDWYLNLADGQAKPPAQQPWHALHRAARRIGDTDACAHAAHHRTADAAVESVVATEYDGLGRLLRALTDTKWINAAPAAAPLPRDVWFPSTEVLLARECTGGSDGLTLAAKGGHNGENHNHNDVGSFVVASDGVPVVVDVGRPTYTAATFGPERYSIWTMQSSWHNVPEISGASQRDGSAFRATEASSTITDDVSSLSLNIAGAYPLQALAQWTRDMRLERATSTLGAARVVIDDTWNWNGDAVAEPTVIHLIIAGAIELRDDGALVQPLDSARPVWIGWSSAARVATTTRQLDDPWLNEVWGTRLTRLELTSTSIPQFSVTIEQAHQTGRIHS